MTSSARYTTLAFLGFALFTAGCGDDVTSPTLSSGDAPSDPSQEIGADARNVLGTMALPSYWPKPDLVIVSTHIVIKTGTSCVSHVSFTVKNISTRGIAYGPINVTAWTESGFKGGGSTGTAGSALWPGQTVEVTVFDTGRTGAVLGYVHAEVDPTNSIAESSEDNNHNNYPHFLGARFYERACAW